jgi:hypothetical protein
MFPPPFDSFFRSDAGVAKKREAESELRLLAQEEFFGKCVDGASERILAETLSLIGRLFEIYFVRLIGTPNQQFQIQKNQV